MTFQDFKILFFNVLLYMRSGSPFFRFLFSIDAIDVTRVTLRDRWAFKKLSKSRHCQDWLECIR